MKTSARSRVVLVLFSTVVSLGFAELALRIVRPSQVIGVGSADVAAARHYGWAFPPNEPVDFVHPDTGRIMSGDRTNSRGWKDVDHTLEKPAGTFRMLFVGDSVTFGVVPLDDLYTRQVQRLLREAGYTHVEVLSMGIGGWGTDQSLEALRREGVEYDPDLVIYQFCGNDVTDNLQPRESTPDHSLFQKKPFRYEIGPEGLKRIEREVQRRDVPWGVRIKKVLLQSALVWNLNQARHALFDLQPRPWEDADTHPRVYTNEHGEVFSKDIRAAQTNDWWAAHKPNPESVYYPYRFGEEPGELRKAWHLLELLILEMKAVSAEHGARFAVFSEECEPGKKQYCFSWDHFERDADGLFIFHDGERLPVNWNRYNANLREVCERNDIPLITPTRTYERYRYDPHANAIGNLAMARDIVDYLIANEMVARGKAGTDHGTANTEWDGETGVSGDL